MATMAVREAQSRPRPFPEGITFVWLALGFIICRYLTDTILPDLGLKQLAHDYESLANNVAPYLELPLCTLLCLQLARRALLPALVAVAGSLALDYWFFVRFDELRSWTGLALIAVAVAASFAALHLGFSVNATRRATRDRRRMIVTLGVVYAVGILVAVTGRRLLEHAAFGGRLGEDLPAAMPGIPSLLALAAYLALSWRERRAA